MGDSVVSLLAAVARGERPPLGPGDAVAANNPYNGGTHLPDITVITPVFAAPPPASEPATSAAVGPTAQVPAVEPAATQLLFFVASRGHHGDVGGLTPGSMPPFSQSIDEEGLLLDNATLLAEGHFDGPGWRERLAAGSWPVRDPDRLLADLQAQLATNQLGATELQALSNAKGSRRCGASSTGCKTDPTASTSMTAVSCPSNTSAYAGAAAVRGVGAVVTA